MTCILMDRDHYVLFGLSKALWLRILDLLSQDSGVVFRFFGY